MPPTRKRLSPQSHEVIILYIQTHTHTHVIFTDQESLQLNFLNNFIFPSQNQHSNNRSSK